MIQKNPDNKNILLKKIKKLKPKQSSAFALNTKKVMTSLTIEKKNRVLLYPN